MDISEDALDTCESTLELKGDDELPMNILCVLSAFQLTAYPFASLGKKWSESVLRNGEDPVLSLRGDVGHCMFLVGTPMVYILMWLNNAKCK